jgi:hypothetical protein
MQAKTQKPTRSTDTRTINVIMMNENELSTTLDPHKVARGTHDSSAFHQ